MRRLAFCLLLLAGCSKAPENVPPPGPDTSKQYVIEIDIDDHGLKALWDAKAPNLKRLIREGSLAYTRVIVPTHSNESNMTLVTGAYPDAHNVPTNSWLNRFHGYGQPFSIGSLGLGDYIFWDNNPLNPDTLHHVDSVWSTLTAANLGPSVYVGQLPPWELGADQVHFTLKGATLEGITLDPKTVNSLLTNTLKYPAEVVKNQISIDGPPNAGETIEHFTIRDAAEVWKAAATGSAPPPYMFVWAFIALNSDPTSTYGGDGPEIAKVVDDYDDALGALLDAIDASPYKGQVNILFTLDHGKTNATNQVCLGEEQLDGQLYTLTSSAEAGALHVGPLDYQVLNEDGDALLYAVANSPDGGIDSARQTEITHGLVDLIQAGSLIGVDTTRTITWDGYKGTRRFHDYRIESPNQADIIVLPKTGWTLNDVDGSNIPGPIDVTKHPHPYGRHGGFSEDELYVPLIMWGPAFKQGVLIPHPVDHVDVAPTAMKILGQSIGSAEGAPVYAALKGDPGETLPDPTDMTTARDLVLGLSGFGGQATLAGAPATQAVIVDVAGLYQDEAFGDSVTQPHLKSLQALASSGVAFDSFWNRYRSWAENEYEALTGGAPVLDASGAWVASAEADPTMTTVPSRGLLQLPAPALGTAGNPAALTAWRATAPWAPDSVFAAAHAAGISTALIGASDFHLAHLPDGSVDAVLPAGTDAPDVQLQTFLAAHPKALAVVALGGKRTADRHSAAALAELDALDAQLAALRAAAPNALFIVTSRGAADIDDPASDAYGPQSARHVPLVIAGPNVRVGAITGQTADAADLPATVLFGLGLAAHTDFVEGTWIQGPVNPSGIPQPVPTTATAGHVLARAFQLQ